MQLANWLPWKTGKSEVEVRREDGNRVHALQTDINKAFENFWRAFDAPYQPFTSGIVLPDTVPKMEVSENEHEITVSVELPGMSRDDVEVSVSDDNLTVRGERKKRTDENRKNYHLCEWSYGLVQRSVPLPAGLDLDAVRAEFDNGVLSVTLPKTEEAKSRVKRISVD